MRAGSKVCFRFGHQDVASRPSMPIVVPVVRRDQGRHRPLGLSRLSEDEVVESDDVVDEEVDVSDGV